jgi:PAS domain-containing protein
MLDSLNGASSGEYLRAVFDAIPHPAFIVGADVRIQDFNQAGAQLLGPAPAMALHQSGGEAFHCIHAGVTGCGQHEFCKTCAIRNSVNEALSGAKSCRKMHKAKLFKHGEIISIDLLITASPLPQGGNPLALLILEDISELLALRDLIPICGQCKKVRDDDQYWHSIDTFLSKHMNLKLSHGLCPACYEEQVKKIQAMNVA